MAKADQNTGVEKIRQLKEQLKGVDLPQEQKDKLIEDAQSRFASEAETSLLADVEKLLGHAKHEALQTYLEGQRLSIYVEFPEDGATVKNEETGEETPAGISIRTRISKPRTSSSTGGSGGGGKKVKVNGEEYDSAAAACRALEISYEGDSAVRVLERALAAKQIESFEVIESSDDDSDDDSK